MNKSLLNEIEMNIWETATNETENEMGTILNNSLNKTWLDSFEAKRWERCYKALREILLGATNGI